MKKLLTLLAVICILLTSCSKKEEHQIYCEWEIIYPDTTIQYKETISNKEFNENSIIVISSSRGTNYLSLNGWRMGCTRNPSESTCPMRLIKYELVK